MATPPPAATGQPDTGQRQKCLHWLYVGWTDNQLAGMRSATVPSLVVCGVPYQLCSWLFVMCRCTQLGCLSASMPNLSLHNAQPDCVLGCYVSVCLYAVCHITACLCHHSLCVCGVPHQPHIRLSVWVAVKQSLSVSGMPLLSLSECDVLPVNIRRSPKLPVSASQLLRIQINLDFNHSQNCCKLNILLSLELSYVMIKNEQPTVIVGVLVQGGPSRWQDPDRHLPGHPGELTPYSPSSFTASNPIIFPIPSSRPFHTP
jgi:hypothetical protein